MASFTTISKLICEISDFFHKRIYPERGTIKALKSYEKKARRDFQKTNKIRLRQEQRITDTALLEVRNCSDVENVKMVLAAHPEGYIRRFVFIWHYYEHINIEQ